MAANRDSAERTEKPTPKRLRDARRDGDVAKSKELTSTVMILAWLVLCGLFIPALSSRLSGLHRLATESVGQPFRQVVGPIGALAVQVLLLGVIVPVTGALVVALLVEFLQVGPVFALKKVKPDISHVNPVAGFRRMFSLDHVAEVLKAGLKTAALCGIVFLVIRGQLPRLMELPRATPGALANAYWACVVRLGAWVIGMFAALSLLDLMYQRYSRTRKLRMSRRDIRRELRDDEGDPHVVARRRALHREWAQQSMLQAVRQSSVVVMNPTHIAVALLYQKGETLVPIIAAKGEDHVAQLIRETAEAAGVPVVHDVSLARGLHRGVEVDDYIPVDFFAPVAAILKWAESVRKAERGDAEHP